MRKVRKIEQKYKRRLNDEARRIQVVKRRFKTLRYIKKRLIVKTLRQIYRNFVKKAINNIECV